MCPARSVPVEYEILTQHSSDRAHLADSATRPSSEILACRLANAAYADLATTPRRQFEATQKVVAAAKVSLREHVGR